MTIDNYDIKYIKKFISENLKRELPSIKNIEKEILKLKKNKEIVIKDLIIRNCDNILELSLI